MSTRSRGHTHRYRRRGVVAVLVAVTLTVLFGVAALAIDVGAMYNTKADLQRTADAAALAAAAVLADYGGDQSPLDIARDTAKQYVEKNHVLGHQVTIDLATDVVFGRAVYDSATNEYTFEPTEVIPDAVRVQVRHTSGSPNGSVSLYFAKIFGVNDTNIAAQATAMMVPRDIAIVADLSGSHTDDSELGSYKSVDINLYDVWDDFPGGIDDAGGSWDPDEVPPGWFDEEGFAPQAAGPAWGYMKNLGFGTQTVTSSYNPSSDSGLVYLKKSSNWSNSALSNALKARGYSNSEVSAIMSSSYDSSGSSYNYRVAIAMGLADWYSGMSGGLWSKQGIPQNQAGNGNTQFGSNELAWVEQFGDRSLNESASIWMDYIGYMTSSSSAMTQENSAFRYRYGIKTFINYLLERRPTNEETPELAGTPEQPMKAVKDAVNFMVDYVNDLDTEDQLSLEIYGTTAKHEVDLTLNRQEVADRLNEMQAAHYDSWTNMGGGIERAIEELTSSRARGSSRKMIILLTDGYANVTESGQVGNEWGGAAYAVEKAEAAAALGFTIFAVSVGVNSKQSLMNQIAEIGTGEHFHAEGTIDEYSEQLSVIFEQLGGKRPVELIK